jgi:hypothetical protein
MSARSVLGRGDAGFGDHHQFLVAGHLRFRLDHFDVGAHAHRHARPEVLERLLRQVHVLLRHLELLDRANQAQIGLLHVTRLLRDLRLEGQIRNPPRPLRRLQREARAVGRQVAQQRLTESERQPGAQPGVERRQVRRRRVARAGPGQAVAAAIPGQILDDP